MNPRQDKQDRETRELLLAIPEHMRPREATLWLEAHGELGKPVDVTVTGSAGPIPGERRTASVPAKPRTFAVEIVFDQGSDRFGTMIVREPESVVAPQSVMSPGWKMDFATRTLKRTRP